MANLGIIKLYISFSGIGICRKARMVFPLLLLLACVGMPVHGDAQTIAFSGAPSTTQLPLPKAIAQHAFKFKGFDTRINDVAQDANGNHLLVGEIRAVATAEIDRDSLINQLFGLKGYANNDGRGILIATDKDYKILRMASSYSGKKVAYDTDRQLFTIGANYFDYLHVGDTSFSAWQPVIVQTSLELKQVPFFLFKPYSCIVEEMKMEGENIKIFTRSDNNKTGEKRVEKVEVITVNPAQFHMDSVRPWQRQLDVQANVVTPHQEVGRASLSEVSKTERGYCFATSNLNPYTLKIRHHLYELQAEKLVEVAGFQDFLQRNVESEYWVLLNALILDSAHHYLTLSHPAATEKELSLTKTDVAFKTLLSQKIPLNAAADFDKLLLLSDGKMVILSHGVTKTWTYSLYDANMRLVKELNSTVPEDYFPTRLKEVADQQIECIFHISKPRVRDCVLQVVNLR
jgi:hypothetical protein